MNILEATIGAWRLPLALTIILSLGACSSIDPLKQSYDTEAQLVVRKSPNDSKQYEYFTLSNKLRVLVVSDSGTDKSAASLVVLRGQNDDPPDHLGLAHFFEHMLFIGTQKYPVVDEYQQFLVSNGGRSNAYTASDHTNYFFDVRPEKFLESLDRFAHFFIDPLLDPNYVIREKKAVHSEYQMQLKDDGWRGNAVLKKAMNPSYPGSQFHIGSNQTLGHTNSDVLREFAKKNYSADQMFLVVLGREHTQKLKRSITDIFSQIPNRNAGPPSHKPPAFGKNQVPVILKSQPTKNEMRLIYSFPIASQDILYKEKPAQYISHLLGHEGPNGLFSELQKKGWITALISSSDRIDGDNSLMSIEIELTESGSLNKGAITKAVFDYIQLIKKTRIEKWRFNELAILARLEYQFQEPVDPLRFVYQTAPLLSRFPPEDVIIGPYLLEKFDPNLIRQHLNQLSIDNLILHIIQQDQEFELTEPYFKVPYSLSRQLPNLNHKSELSFTLPKPNPFIPKNLSLIENDNLAPTKIADSPDVTFWLDRDTEFGSPRTNLYLNLLVPGGFNSAKDLAIASLYARLVINAKNELAYDALVAGLKFDLSATAEGFELIISGYSDKQLHLLETVLKDFQNLSFDSLSFDLFRAALVKQWNNFYMEKPYIQALSTLHFILSTGHWPPDQLAKALSNLSQQDLEQWQAEKLQKVKIRGLAHGNTTKDNVRKTIATLKNSLQTEDFPNCPSLTFKLDQPYYHQITVDHPDTTIVLHFQDNDKQFESRALSALATQIMQQAYFTDLRTKQQLGYVVSLNNRPINGVAGLTFLVQSPVASAPIVYGKTKNFLDDQIKRMSAMNETEFEQHKTGLLSQLREVDKNLNGRTNRYWADLVMGHTSFDSNIKIGEYVIKIERNDLINYLARIQNNLKEKSLVIASNGKFQEAIKFSNPITDQNTFKDLLIRGRNSVENRARCGHTTEL